MVAKWIANEGLMSYNLNLKNTLHSILCTQEGFASEATGWVRPFVRLYFILFYICVLVSILFNNVVDSLNVATTGKTACRYETGQPP